MMHAIVAAWPHLVGLVSLGFTLVPEPDWIKAQMVDQAVSEGLQSWVANNDGSLSVQLKAGEFKFMPAVE